MGEDRIKRSVAGHPTQLEVHIGFQRGKKSSREMLEKKEGRLLEESPAGGKKTEVKSCWPQLKGEQVVGG